MDIYQYYTYKHVLYRRIDEIQSKHPDTGEWGVSVLYQDISNDLLYTREVSDFYSKFSHIQNVPVNIQLKQIKSPQS